MAKTRSEYTRERDRELKEANEANNRANTASDIIEEQDAEYRDKLQKAFDDFVNFASAAHYIALDETMIEYQGWTVN